jgi:hypothetical protein
LRGGAESEKRHSNRKQLELDLVDLDGSALFEELPPDLRLV